MSVTTENAPVQGQTTLQENRAGEGVYASLFEKINLAPASHLGDINDFLDDAALSEAPAAERLTAAMQVFMDRIRQSGQRVEKLDKTLIDHHIAELDFQISRQLDAVMHHQEFQQVESLWRGLKQLVDNTDYRQNVKTEILDVAKDDLRQDFEDAPELIQSGLYWHTYTAEYDTPGGEPIGSVISAYEFDASPQDVALLRNISRVSAAAHMPFIGAVGPAFFLKETMEEVAAIKDIGILQEGRSGILRFYDTRVFPLLFTHILSEEQQEPLMRPALFWAWQDFDGQAKGIKGSGLPPERDENAPKIELSDRQLEHLMCISDVIVMLSHCAPPAGMFDSRQSLFSACYQGMVEATRQGLLLDDAREDWVMKKWFADVKTSERPSE